MPNDWVLGVAGKALGSNVYQKCIVLMKVTEKLTYEEYWHDERFKLKKPCRNGSLMKMVGDNIYHRDKKGAWIQEDSHHSMPDGTPNEKNLRQDTSGKNVLISEHFFYFGKRPVSVNLHSIPYKNGIGHSKKNLDTTPNARNLILKMHSDYKDDLNVVFADPCQFENSYLRVDQQSGELSS
jgi:hypothetical protein